MHFHKLFLSEVRSFKYLEFAQYTRMNNSGLFQRLYFSNANTSKLENKEINELSDDSFHTSAESPQSKCAQCIVWLITFDVVLLLPTVQIFWSLRIALFYQTELKVFEKFIF